MKKKTKRRLRREVVVETIRRAGELVQVASSEGSARGATSVKTLEKVRFVQFTMFSLLHAS